MVLPSGDTRISGLPKGNQAPQSSVQSLCLSDCDRRPPQTNHADQTAVQDHDDDTDIRNGVTLFKQTDVGLTDPRLVRNVPKDKFHFNEALNNFSASSSSSSVGGSRSVPIDLDRSDLDRVHRVDSVAGRFARACLLHDANTSDAVFEVYESIQGVPGKTSQRNARCLSYLSSDGQESCLSAQSEVGTPNDDSRSDSFTDNIDGLGDVVDMSASVEEQTSNPLAELDCVSSGSQVVFVNHTTTRDFQASGRRFKEASENSKKDNVSAWKTPEDSNGGDFDVYSIENTLPYMNWDYLEEQLQKAIEKEQLSQSQRNDREKIRQKLAMGLDDDQFASGSGVADRLFKKPSLQVRLHGATSLQMCFVNEASNEIGENGRAEVEKGDSNPMMDRCRREKSSSRLLQSLSSQSNSLDSSKTSLHSAAMPASASSSSTNTGATQEELDFFTRQARLQAEARLALAQVRPMAHMQLQLEKQTRRKSPIADIVGIPGFGDGKNGRLGRQLLRRMNLGQLQVVVNDMHAQIEGFNTELMELLVERDDLHMAQDSMLVDIEDLTRRAQEYDMRTKSTLPLARGQH